MLGEKGQHAAGSCRQNIVALVYPGMVALDLVGPVEAFRYATHLSENVHYHVDFVGLTDNPTPTASTIEFATRYTIDNFTKTADILLIPGMMDPDDQSYQSTTVLGWVREQCARSKRLVCVCSGVFLPAEAGVLNDETVTTHWNDSTQLRERFPNLKVSDDLIFMKSDRVYTSGGVTAGIDLALSIIAEDHGRGLASKVAKRMLVYLQRQGNQRQFSDILSAQSRADRFHDILGWIEENLLTSFNVEDLSARCAMSPRNFSRAFKNELGVSPMAYVRQRRLEKARILLEEQNSPVSEIARSCGFMSLDQFGRAFNAMFGISPQNYRMRFRNSAALSQTN